MSEPKTPQEIAAAYGASDAATQRLVEVLIDARAQQDDAAQPEDWPYGSGTEEDPYVSPPGWTLDSTWEDAQAALDAGEAQP